MEKILTSSCQVAPDQRKTFMPKLAEATAEVQVDSTFTNDQQNAIRDAADRCNRVARGLTGADFFTVRVTSLADSLRSVDPHVCSNKYGTQRQFVILNETNLTHWKTLGLNSSVPGATVRCFSSTEVSQQMVWLFPGLISTEQFSSVVIHELGHTLGLDHSCMGSEGTPEEKFIACQGLSSSHPYRQAIMYPSLRVTTPGASKLTDPPEIKNDLRSNDVLRTQCLYDSKDR
jgi:hypothetical protein